MLLLVAGCPEKLLALNSKKYPYSSGEDPSNCTLQDSSKGTRSGNGSIGSAVIAPVR